MGTYFASQIDKCWLVLNTYIDSDVLSWNLNSSVINSRIFWMWRRSSWCLLWYKVSWNFSFGFGWRWHCYWLRSCFWFGFWSYFWFCFWSCFWFCFNDSCWFSNWNICLGISWRRNIINWFSGFNWFSWRWFIINRFKSFFYFLINSLFKYSMWYIWTWLRSILISNTLF